jgi:hypothetical protein
MSGHPLAKPEKSGFHTSPVGLALAANGNAFFRPWGAGSAPPFDFDGTIEWVTARQSLGRRLIPRRNFFNEGVLRFEDSRRLRHRANALGCERGWDVRWRGLQTARIIPAGPFRAIAGMNGYVLHAVVHAC